MDGFSHSIADISHIAKNTYLCAKFLTNEKTHSHHSPVFCFASLQAQETTFWGKVNRFLTKPAVVDSSHIYQPKPGFSLGLFTTGQKAGFDVGVDFDLKLDETHLLKGIST